MEKNVFDFFEREIELFIPLGAEVEVMLFPALELPENGFLQKKIVSIDSDLLRTLLNWKTLNIHEKHTEVVRLFFDAENQFLPGAKEKGYALAYFRSDGEENTLSWKGPDKTESDLEWNQIVLDSIQNSVTDARENEEQSPPLRGECAPLDGVDIWEWIPSVVCWIQSFEELGIFEKRVCSVDAEYDALSAQPFRDRRTGDLVEPLSREDPVGIRLTTSDLVLSPGMKSHLSGDIVDANGVKTAAGGIEITVSLHGAGELLVADINPDAAGIQIFVVSGSFEVPFQATQTGKITLTATSEVVGTQEISVSVVSELKLNLELSDEEPQQNKGVTLFTVDISVQGEEGNEIGNNGEVTVAISDPTKAILSNTRYTLKEGKATLPVGVRRGPVTLSATMPYAQSAKLLLGENGGATEIAEILFLNPPETLSLNSPTRIDLALRLASGDVVSAPEDFPEDLSVTVHSSTQSLAQAQKEGNQVVITPSGDTGTLRIIAEYKNTTTPLELSFGSAITAEGFAVIRPNALMTQFFGTPTAHPLHSNLAQDMIFSGKTLSFTGLTQSATSSAQRASIGENGDVHIIDETVVATLSSLDPLSITLLDGITFKTLSEFELLPPANGVLTTKGFAPGENGVLFSSLDTADVLTTSGDNKNIEIFLDGRKIMSVDAHLSFQIFDNRFSLKVLQDENKNLQLGLMLDHTKHVGQFVIKGAKILPQNGESSAGHIFFDETEEVLLYEGASDAVSQDVGGVGWEQEAIANLLIAGGQNIGNAMKHMTTPLLMTWGDPTLSLKPPAVGSTGFDNTVGTEVHFSPFFDFQSLDDAEIDGDELSDIVLQKGSETAEFLLASTEGAFRNWGEGLELTKGIDQILSSDSNDNFSDLLVETNDDHIVVHNEKGVLSIQETLEDKVHSALLEDLDGDGYSDLVAHTLSGELQIRYGTRNGELEDPVRLDVVGGTLSDEGISDTLLISGLDIPEGVFTEEFLIPSDTKPSQSEVAEVLSAQAAGNPSGSNLWAAELTDGIQNSNTFDSGSISYHNSNIGETALFTALSNIPARGIQKTLHDVNGNTLQKNDRVQVTLTVSSQSSELHLRDMILAGMEYDPQSLACTGCTEEMIIIPPSSREGLVLQVWNIPAEASIQITYDLILTDVPEGQFILEHISEEGFPNDEIVDISFFFPNSEDQEILSFISTGKRSYTKHIREQEEPETPDFLPDITDADHNGIPDTFETDSDADGISDHIQGIQDGWSADENENGIADYFDDGISFQEGILTVGTDGSEFGEHLDTLDRKLGKALDVVNNATCQGGGCLALPINYAFLVPGPVNISQALVNAATQTLQGGLKPIQDFQSILNSTGGAGLASRIGNLENQLNQTLGKLANGEGAKGPNEPFVAPVFGFTKTPPKFVCFGPECIKDKTSYFRFYISPTLNGGTGIALCNGLYSVGKCFATGVPILDSVTNICKEINESIQNVLSKADKAISSVGGNVAFVVDGSTQGNIPTSGRIGVDYEIGTVRFNTSSGRNAVPQPGPGLFDRWVSAQIGEIKKAFEMPTFTLVYPDFTGASLREDQEERVPPAEPPEAQKEEGAQSAYDTLDLIQDGTEKINQKIESVEQMYSFLKSIPLLDVEEETFSIQVPHIPRSEMSRIVDDMSSWKEHAINEIADWKEFIAHWECEEGISEEECSKAKQAWQKMQERVDTAYQGTLNSIDRNLEILEEYTNFRNIVSHFDEELAKYINGLICYVDAITDLMSGWFQTNLNRVKSWILFFETAKEIKKQWEDLIKAIDNPTKNCSACKAEKFTTANSVFEGVLGLLPTPPVLTFPSLPDIVLDISQIKASIEVSVPRLRFFPVEVPFPKLPRLKLPRVPTVTLVLPEVPLLPQLPPLPELPPFPDVSIPELPTVPPPPKLPKVTADISKIMRVTSKLLELYCLFVKKGLFIYPEQGLKPIIETLTNRPASVLLDMDFLNLSFPSVNIPGIDEIRVHTQVNFTLSFESVLEVVGTQVDKWNGLVFEKRKELLKVMNEHFDFGDILDFRHTLPEDIRIQPLPGERGGDDLPPRTPLPSDPVDSLEKPNQSIEPISQEMIKQFALLQKLSQQTGEISVEEAAEHFGIAEPSRFVPFRTTPSYVYLQNLRTALLDREEQYRERSRNLLARDDISILFEEERSRKTKSERIASLSEIPKKHVAQLVPPPQTPSLSSNSSSQSVHNSAPAGEYQRRGVFVYDHERKSAQKVVAYDDFANSVRDMRFVDIDRDGDEDLLLLTAERVLVKENRTFEKPKLPVPFDPEIGSLSSFTPEIDAVKNISLQMNGSQVSLSFAERDAPRIAGVEIILTNALTGHVRDTGSKTKYVLLLKEEHLPTGAERDVFLSGPRSQYVLKEEMNIERDEEIMISELIVPFTEFDLEEGFWTIKMRYLMADGKTGTLSEGHLAASIAQNDDSSPLFVGESTKRIPIFTTENISAEGIFDFESSLSFAWDLDRDGVTDAQGYEVQVGPFDEPQTKGILLTATDEGGNATEVPLLLEVFAPDVILTEADLAQKKITGRVSPPLKDIPISLLRNRFDTWKMIKTSSADQSGRYMTDQKGTFTVPDLSLSSDAVIKDTAGKIIGRVSASTGQIILEAPGYRLEVFPGDGTYFPRVAIVSSDGRIASSVFLIANDRSDVYLSLFEFTKGSVGRLSGVSVFDRDIQDQIEFGNLPADASVFAGGGIIFDANEQKTLAMISKEGDIRFTQNDMNLRLKTVQDPASEPLVLEVLRNNDVVFDIFITTNFQDIVLHQGEDLTAKSSRLAVKQDVSKFASSHQDPAEIITTTLEFPFSDLNAEHPYADAIFELYTRNILEGYADSTFRPDQQITRAEFVKIVLGATACADCTNPSTAEIDRFFEPFPFPDVSFEQWYAFCVSKAKKLGMIEGYGDGQFKPVNNISRAEAVAILLRSAEVSLEETSDVSDTLRDVPDDAWYSPYVLTGINLGLIPVRDGGFVLPEQPITRAEFAFMAKKILDVADCREKDTDGDGLMDFEEIDVGLDETDPNDADEDADADGVSNADEIAAGTNPFGDDADDDTQDGDSSEGDADDTSSTDETDTDTNTSDTGTDSDLSGDSNGDGDGDTDGKKDVCPFLPTDLDDARGCPIIPEAELLSPGVHIFPGDPALCGLLDFVSDIRAGDLIKAAILNTENTVIFSESTPLSF